MRNLLIPLLAAPLLLTAAAGPVLAGDDPIHVHMVSGSKEYKSEPSLKAWGERLETSYANIEVSYSLGKDGGKELPNLDAVAEADVLVVFLRRNNLPAEQLAKLKAHWEAGKPVIGIRTASHAFDRETNKTFDGEVLGGAYSGHLGNEQVAVMSPLDGVHPVLRGVEPWDRPGKLYKNSADKLAASAVVLLVGKGDKSGQTFPIAWVNTFGEDGKGRAFYTSMGYPHDFEHPQFQRLIDNAVAWTTGRGLDAKPAAADQPAAALPLHFGVAAAVFAAGDPSGEQAPDPDLLPHGDPDPDPEDVTGVEVDLPEYPGHLAAAMDYGPCLSFSIDVTNKTTVPRALTVRLSEDASVCYDIDRMRVAAVWDGGFVDLKNTHHRKMKGRDDGKPAGRVRYLSGDAPGWARPAAADKQGEPPTRGPLPDAWLDYRGHYLHGDRVVLSYTVGGREVLESPSLAAIGDDAALVRSLHVGPGDSPVTLAVSVAGDDVAFADGRGTPSPAAGRSVNAADFAVIADGSAVEPAVVLAARGEAAWRFENGQVLLEAPAARDGRPVEVYLYAGDADRAGDVLKLARQERDRPALPSLTRGGPLRWDADVSTEVKPGEPRWGYAADEIALPEKNPWGTWMQMADVDALPDGRLVVTTLNGDVWLVAGLQDDDPAVSWKRYATGLYEPLGLHVKDGDIYVSGRDRVTRLHDLNDDGEADFYESFYDGGTTSTGYHAFTFGLDTDSEGNFYTVKSGRKVEGGLADYNAVIRISPDGKTGEPIAWGFRHPNGLCVGPNDELLVSDNQGEWIPNSKQSLIQEGKFYGYLSGPASKRFKTTDFTEPVFWIDRAWDSSSGAAAWADAKRWGPLSGELLHTSYSHCKLFYVVTDDAGLGGNAAAVPMPWTFKSGLMRAAVNPKDGQLYVTGLKGWDTRAKADGCLSRVRHVGGDKPSALLTGFGVDGETITLHFSGELDPASLTGDAFNASMWNYLYSKRYGSTRHDAQKLEAAATLGEDGRSVALRLPGLKPVDQLELTYELKDAAGNEVEQRAIFTLKKVGDATRQRGPKGI